MGNKVFKTQKEYIRYLRWQRRVTQILSIVSVLLLCLYIVLMNSHSLTAWLVFAAYVLLMVFLNYHAKQELLKKDTETAKQEEQARLARNNKKKISKQK